LTERKRVKRNEKSERNAQENPGRINRLFRSKGILGEKKRSHRITLGWEGSRTAMPNASTSVTEKTLPRVKGVQGLYVPASARGKE